MGAQVKMLASCLTEDANPTVEVEHKAVSSANEPGKGAKVTSLLAKIYGREPPTDFEWSSQEEPHRSRRKQILEAHPEIKELFTHDIPSGIFCVCSVLFQFAMIYVIPSFDYWQILILCLVVGGTVNHSLELAAHELSHDLFFPERWMNKWCGYFACLPTGVASSTPFKRYHLMHHSQQGDDKADLDIATELEAFVYRGKLGKLAFVFLQVFSYALRPSIMHPLPMTQAEQVGWAIQLTFDALVYYFFGWKSIVYMFGSDLLGLGIHPMAGHFISEHYVFLPGGNKSTKAAPLQTVGQETYSYYGPLNYLAYNVGYHNEHHDFPRVPGRLLPKVKAIAPEFYDMPHYTSWSRVLWDFVMCDHVTLKSRVKRVAITERENVSKKD